MPFGAGKAEVAQQKMEKLLVEDNAPISGMIIFARPEIEAGHQPGLMERLGPEAPPNDLHVIAGSTLLTVGGYSETEAEIYEIPACRKFFQSQTVTWAPWLFAGSIWTADLMAVVLTCLPRVTCLRRGADLFVRWESDDIQEFFEKSLPTAAWLHSRAGIRKEKGCAMLKASAAYLGLPFPK